MSDCLNGFGDHFLCQFILDQPNATSNSVVTQEVGVSDPSELVAIAVEIEGSMNAPESADPPNIASQSMIPQDSGFPEINQIILVAADISWISE